MFITIAAVFFVGMWATVFDSGEEALLRIEHGIIRGQSKYSATGDTFFSFQGIPYAEPPLGHLRFKDAQPVKSWEGVYDAISEKSACTQFDWEESKFLGEEDCLYLNVYTPQLPSEDVNNLLPVMVWIHGGGFVFGSSDTRDYGPDYLVSEGVVLVSMNYRLGPFGFLYMNEDAPGNVGLKDQVAALRWVQRNIEIFGGDPTRVTIFGNSAGGASVHYHMLSPMSKGLFGAAIAQSGLAVNPWAVRSRMQLLRATGRLARAVGCGGADIGCLRAADAMTLMRAAATQAPTEEGRFRFLNFLFVPTHDLKVPDVEQFLPAPAIQLVEEGRQLAVPFITGLTNQENLLLIASLTDNINQTALEKLDSHWDKHVLPELRLRNNSNNARAIEMLRAFFLNNKPLSKETFQRYLDMFSDIHTGEGITYMLKHVLKTVKTPIYLYNFVVDDELNLMKKGYNISWPGAAHGDEIGYLFHTTYLPDAPSDSSAAMTRKIMVRLWTNFAKYRNTTYHADEILEPNWPPYTLEDNNYLEIGSKLRAGRNLNAERTQFWGEFYKINVH